MNKPRVKAEKGFVAEVMVREPFQPTICSLPEFVKIPPVPGLPTELTGAALRDALQHRADSQVCIRHA